MRRFMLILPMLVLTLGSSCKVRKEKSSQTPPAAGKDFLLEIHHTGCRGTCPDFIVTVHADGTADYEGRRSVKQMGIWTKSLDVKTVNELAAALNTAKFWEFAEGYGTEVADVPGIRITATNNGQKHSVWDIRNAPAELKELESRLESLIGEEGYSLKP